MKTWIERVRPDRFFGRHLDRWKQMRQDGWQLTVLEEKQTGDVVALGVRYNRW